MKRNRKRFWIVPVLLLALGMLCVSCDSGGGGDGGDGGGNGDGGEEGGDREEGGGDEGGGENGGEGSLLDALTRIKAEAVDGGEYTIVLTANETISANGSMKPQTLDYGGKTVSITITGDSTERTVSLTYYQSPIFTVESGVTLTLGNNLVLRGHSNNKASLVQVNHGGALVMQAGSKITGNTAINSISHGGGVYVSGTFTMNGGEISDNSSFGLITSTSTSYSSYSHGGGVYVYGGTFTMNGGKISGNTAKTLSSASSESFGGGVAVGEYGTFTMNDGEISGNTASSTGAERDIRTSSEGGGVYAYGSGTFAMNGGKISGNTTSSSNVSSSYSTRGGGVYVDGKRTFTMSGGEISGNTAFAGGGVYVDRSSVFTMSGNAKISGNTANNYGGGVYVAYATFTMNDGEISGNTVSGSTITSGGGGVCVTEIGMFIKQPGGVIYGSDASDTLKNTAASGNGHAVYDDDGSKRNTTAGQGVTLDSRKNGALGGWE
jgi:hypothetical protein